MRNANESYQNAENNLLLLTGMKVGHSNKIEAKKKHYQQLEADLWMGEVEASISYLKKLKPIGGTNIKLLNVCYKWKSVGAFREKPLRIMCCIFKVIWYNFCKYLKKHHQRIVNYHYFQWQQICSVGSGAVESAVKQIGERVKMTGAQWKAKNVPQILQLRCAYLNSKLAI